MTHLRNSPHPKSTEISPELIGLYSNKLKEHLIQNSTKLCIPSSLFSANAKVFLIIRSAILKIVASAAGRFTEMEFLRLWQRKEQGLLSSSAHSATGPNAVKESSAKCGPLETSSSCTASTCCNHNHASDRSKKIPVKQAKRILGIAQSPCGNVFHYSQISCLICLFFLAVNPKSVHIDMVTNKDSSLLLSPSKQKLLVICLMIKTMKQGQDYDTLGFDLKSTYQSLDSFMQFIDFFKAFDAHNGNPNGEHLWFKLMMSFGHNINSEGDSTHSILAAIATPCLLMNPVRAMLARNGLQICADGTNKV